MPQRDALTEKLRALTQELKDLDQKKQEYQEDIKKSQDEHKHLYENSPYIKDGKWAVATDSLELLARKKDVVGRLQGSSLVWLY